MIDFALDGCFCQNLGGLLEGSRGQEGIRCQRGFGNTQKDLFALRGLLALRFHLLVDILVIQHVHHGARQEIRVSAFLDADLFQHLAHNHLDVLVADLNALETVHSLYLPEHVVLHVPNALDPQDIVGIHASFRELIAGLQNRSVLDLDPGTVGNQVGLGNSFLLIGDDNLTLLLSVLDRSHTLDLRDDGKTLGLPGLEKLLHTGKTLGDIAAGHAAGVEGTHGQLGTRLTDGLGRDDTYRLSYLHRLAGSHVGSIALGADTDPGTAGKDGTDLDFLQRIAILVHALLNHPGCPLGGNHMVGLHDYIAVFVCNGLGGESSGNTLLQRFDLLLAVSELLYIHARNLLAFRPAVGLPDNQILGNIYHSPGQITGVGGTQSRIGQTFSGSVGGHEVLQYVQTLTEVGLDGQLNGVSGGIRHQPPHAGQLLNLLIGTTGSGVSHHENIVVFIQTGKQGVGQLIVRLFPGLHYLFVPLLVSNQAALVVSGDPIHRILGSGNQLRLLGRHGHIGNRYGHGRSGGIFVAHGFNIIQHLGGLGGAMGVDDFLQDLLQLLFSYQEVHLQFQLVAGNAPVHVAQILGQDLVKEKSSQGRGNCLCQGISLGIRSLAAHMNAGLQGNIAVFVCQNGFIYALVISALTLGPRSLLGQVIDAKHHILRRHRHRSSVGRLQQVVGRQQHKTALGLGFHRQGKMHSHLVSVEVRVEGGTYQGVQLDCLSFYQNGLKGLNAQTVQGRSAVQHDRMLFDYILQHVPNLRLQLLHHLFGVFNIVGGAVGHQLLHNEGLEQLNGHLFGQTALVDLQLRSHHDNGTSGIVHALAQQVLTEPAGLTFQHVRQGLQRPVSGSCHRTAPASVVDEGVHCLLEHTLLIADNNIRSAQLQQSLQAVVPVNDSSVQIVQVGGGEPSAVQLHHGAQIRRDHRDGVHDHPLRTVSGLPECLHYFHSLDDSGPLLAGGLLQSGAQFLGLFLQINGAEQFLDSLCPHPYPEGVPVLFSGILVFLLRENLLILQSGVSAVQHNVAGKVEHFLQGSRGKVQDQAHPGGDSLKVPDMGNRSSQFDMSHPLPANGSLGDFHAAAVADHAFVADLFIFSTVTLPVLGRPEDPLAEQTVFFRLQSSVVDSLRLFYLPVGPLPDLFRGSQADLDGVKGHGLVSRFFIYCFWHLITPFHSMYHVPPVCFYSSASSKELSRSSRNSSSLSSPSSMSMSSPPSNSCLPNPYSPKDSSSSLLEYRSPSMMECRSVSP